MHHFTSFSPRDFTLGLAAGMFLCACLFNYVFWQEKRRDDAMEFLRKRFDLK